MKKTSFYFIGFCFLTACNFSNKEQPSHTVSKNTNTEAPIITKVTPLDSVSNIIEKEPIPKEIALTKDSIPTKEDKLKPSKKEVAKSVTKPQQKVEKSAAKKKIENTEPLLKSIKNKVSVAITPKEITSKIPLKPSHTKWNTLTKSFVSKNGKVNYAAFKSNLVTVKDYLKALENNPPTKKWSKSEKLAYWFNLYNASTVYLVATNYPIKSIKDINNGKPWDKKFIKSGSALYSLNEIENTIVRPHYNEPRLHVAFNCAAVSCPKLLNEAFVAKKLNAQLNKLAKQWITDTTKNDLTNPEKIKLSQIFNWYKVDFTQGIIPFINNHSTNRINEKAEVTYLPYNWKLND